MNNNLANQTADYLSTLPARSDFRVTEAAEVFLGRTHQTQYVELQRALVRAAVPLVRTVGAVRYADVFVDVMDLGRALSGEAIIPTEDCLIHLHMSAKQGRDVYETIRNASSSAEAVRRADVVQLDFKDIRTVGTPKGDDKWEPTGTVTLHMRDGDPIELKSFDGASLAQLGNALTP